jgi:hypothetical protein
VNSQSPLCLPGMLSTPGQVLQSTMGPSPFRGIG